MMETMAVTTMIKTMQTVGAMIRAQLAVDSSKIMPQNHTYIHLI